tara:strand:- start:217 stop:489 length:273 start_codon:yes stop_codon:yes gene_type:complete
MTKDQIIQMVTLLVPTLIAVGGFISVQESTAADVVALEEAVSVHSSLPSHPVGASQMESMREEQRMMQSDLVTVRENVAAICAATGARCK